MEYKGKLHETVEKFPCTDVWNDSCAKDELEYASREFMVISLDKRP